MGARPTKFNLFFSNVCVVRNGPVCGIPCLFLSQQFFGGAEYVNINKVLNFRLCIFCFCELSF